LKHAHCLDVLHRTWILARSSLRSFWQTW
jgi:hypothetical protein